MQSLAGLLSRRQPFQRWVAVLTLLSWLGTVAMAACPGLHHRLHKDADHAGHQCAVTLLSHGKVDCGAVEAPTVTAVVATEIRPACELEFFAPVTLPLPDGRAPPASASVI